MTETIIKKKGNPSKRKGDRWERELSKRLATQATSAKRIPGSGALGTILNMSGLTADVAAEYKFLKWPIKIEAKYGYGGSTQMTIKREWMEKVRMQARNGNYIPAVGIKFPNVTGGDIESSMWLCLSLEDWNGLMKYFNELYSDMEEYWEWKYEQKSKRV